MYLLFSQPEKRPDGHPLSSPQPHPPKATSAAQQTRSIHLPSELSRLSLLGKTFSPLPSQNSRLEMSPLKPASLPIKSQVCAQGLCLCVSGHVEGFVLPTSARRTPEDYLSLSAFLSSEVCHSHPPKARSWPLLNGAQSSEHKAFLRAVCHIVPEGGNPPPGRTAQQTRTCSVVQVLS